MKISLNVKFWLRWNCSDDSPKSKPCHRVVALELHLQETLLLDLYGKRFPSKMYIPIQKYCKSGGLLAKKIVWSEGNAMMTLPGFFGFCSSAS